MLLPATFALLLPVMMLPAPALSAQVARAAVPVLYIVAIGMWAVTCGVGWRIALVPGIPRNGIVDERAFWVIGTHQQNPGNPAEFVLAQLGSASTRGSFEWMITQDTSSGKPKLQYEANALIGTPFVAVPLSRPGYPVALAVSILGTWGSATPLDGLDVDQRGLAYALGSHLVGDPNGRPGHTKWAVPAWIIAEYSNATTAPGVPAADIAAARKALSCGTLAQLDQATQAPLTAGRFMSNIFNSLTLTTSRFSPDPVIAETELCG
jgi:arabinofuranosyltransferase